MDQPAKTEASESRLTQAYNLAAQTIKSIPTALWFVTKSYYFDPYSINRLVTAFTLFWAINSCGHDLMFDDGKNYFEDQGVPVSLIEDLTDQSFRVVEPSLKNRTLLALSYPLPWFFGIYEFASARGGYMRKIPFFQDEGLVVPLHETDDIADYLERGTNIPLHDLRPKEISADLWWTYILLHEVRHTASENRSLPSPLREANADIKALDALSNITNTDDLQSLRKHVTLLRIFAVAEDRTFSHDTGLTLDNYYRTGSMLEAEDIEFASTETRTLIRKYGGNDDVDDYFINYQALTKALVSEPHLDPLVKRTAELYIEACETFSKRAYEAALKRDTPSPIDIYQQNAAPAV